MLCYRIVKQLSLERHCYQQALRFLSLDSGDVSLPPVPKCDMLLRRFRTRVFAALGIVGTCLLISVYYAPESHVWKKVRHEPSRLWTLIWPEVSESCWTLPPPGQASDKWNTADIYPKLPFALPESAGMGFWNDALENRYREIKDRWKDLPLKVNIN